MKKITLFFLALFTVGMIQAQSTQRSSARMHSTSKKQSPISNLQKSGVGTHVAASNLFTDNMDGDNSVAGLTAKGYTTYFRGTGGPGIAPEWIQGDTSVFFAFNGNDSSYVAGTFQSVTNTNDIDNWLVLDTLNITAGNVLSFFCRTELGSTFPDSIRVMYNATGATLPEDLNWVELGRFEVDVAGTWIKHSYAAPNSSATGMFAIRYAVADGGPAGNNSDYIGIDQIEVNDTTVILYTNDDCLGATDINSFFGQALGIEQVAGPYDNTAATTGPSDPADGFECWGEPTGNGAAPEINNSLWFTFVGDGGNYFVESGNCAGVTNYISDGDTQFALYTGTCGALVPEACNEDGPNATATVYPAGFSFGTTLGTTYYLLVDGFSFNGAVSIGQFCLKVTKLQTIGCTDPSLTFGTVTSTPTLTCFGDTLRVSAISAISQNTGSFNGICWIVSAAPLTGSTDPLNDPNFITSYRFQSPVPDTSARFFVNDGAFLTPGSVFYWTPVLFGNAVKNTVNPLFLQDLVLDPNCTTTGTSIAFDLKVAGDPVCSVGISESTATTYYGISNIYPVPAKNDINFTITAKENIKLVVSVKDNIGKEVSSKQLNAVKGENKITLDLNNTASGLYFINVSGEKGSYNVKFVKN